MNENKKTLFKFNKSFFYCWEMILVYILIILNIALMIAFPNIYFSSGTITTIIRSGMVVSFMVLGMVFVLILGEIDISIGSIMLLSSFVMGICFGAGIPGWICLLIGIIVGGICGLFNGVLVSVFKMPSFIVTLATAILFRGIVRAFLKDNCLDTFPSFFTFLAWEDIGGIIPISLVIFLCFAVIFGIILHKSKFGRQLFLIGSNKKAVKYSGINVSMTKILAFVILGITCALSAVLFSGRFGGITYSMSNGYDLKVIAIVVLGGVSTLGGKGKIYGPIIATFIMAFLSKVLDLFEVHPNIQNIAIGIVLIFAILIARIDKTVVDDIKKKLLTFKKDKISKNDINLSHGENE